MVLSETAQGVMVGEENQQIDVGQDWICFDAGNKEYDGEEGGVLLPYRPAKNSVEQN